MMYFIGTYGYDYGLCFSDRIYRELMRRVFVTPVIRIITIEDIPETIFTVL